MPFNMKVRVTELKAHVGASVTAQGWLYNRRSGKSVHFLELRDGMGIVQCIIGKNDVSLETFELAGQLTQETSLELTGVVRAHPKRADEFELGVTDLKLLGKADDYPITPKEH